MSPELRSSLKRFDPFDLAFVFLVLAAGLTNVLWFLTDSHVCGVDSQNHLFFSIELFHRLSSVILSDLPALTKIAAFFREFNVPYFAGCVYWPQGLSLSTCFFYSVAGKTLFAAKLTLLPYLFLLLFSTYCIGKHIGSSLLGFMAATLLFFYPVIFQSSRQYQLDFPLTAMVTLGILFLLKSEKFQNAKYSLFFGVASGWAMLIKGQYVIFMLMPLIYVLYGSVRTSELEAGAKFSHLRQVARNLAIAFAAFVFIAMIWWGPLAKNIFPALYSHIFHPEKILDVTPFLWSEKFSMRCIAFQTVSLFYSSVRPFLSLFFLMALPFFLTKRIKGKGIFLAWVIFPVIFFSLAITLKHTRFLMPVLPAVALITAAGLCHIKSKVFRNLIFWGGALFAILQFCVLSYAPLRVRRTVVGGFKIFGESGFGSDYETTYPLHIHDQEGKIAELVKTIERYRQVQVPRVLFLRFPGAGYGQWELPFRMLLVRNSLKAVFVEVLPFEQGEIINSVDFLVCISRSKIPKEWFMSASFETLLRSNEYWTRMEEQVKSEDPRLWEEFLENVRRNNHRFELVGYEKEAHSSAMAVYKRNIEK